MKITRRFERMLIQCGLQWFFAFMLLAGKIPIFLSTFFAQSALDIIIYIMSPWEYAKQPPLTLFYDIFNLQVIHYGHLTMWTSFHSQGRAKIKRDEDLKLNKKLNFYLKKTYTQPLPPLFLNWRPFVVVIMLIIWVMYDCGQKDTMNERSKFIY